MRSETAGAKKREQRVWRKLENKDDAASGRHKNPKTADFMEESIPAP